MKQQIKILPSVLIVMEGNLKPLWQRALGCGVNHVIPVQHATLTYTGYDEDGIADWCVHGIDHSWSLIIAAGSEASLPTVDEAKAIYADARDFLMVSLLQDRAQQKVFHFDGRKLIVGQHMSALLSKWMSLVRAIMPYQFKNLEAVVQDIYHLVGAHCMLLERTFLLSDPRLEAEATASAKYTPAFLLVEHLDDYDKLPDALRQLKGLSVGVLPQQIAALGTGRIIFSAVGHL